MEKKSVVFWLAFLFSPLVVLAQRGVMYAPTMTPLGSFSEFLGKVYGWIFLNAGGAMDVNLARGMMLLLFFFILFSITSKLPAVRESKFIRFAVSLILAIMGTRFLPDDIVRGVFLPTEALAITLTVLIPIFLYGWLAYNVDINNPAVRTLRKIGWVFYIVTLVGLWAWRSLSGDAGEQVSLIYLVGAAACGLFLWMDGTIARWRMGWKIGKEQTAVAMATVDTLTHERNDVLKTLGDPNIDSKRIPALKKRLKAIEKRLLELRTLE